jgi:hypothetical protein
MSTDPMITAEEIENAADLAAFDDEDSSDAKILRQAAAEIRRITAERDFYKRRSELLQQHQSRMRDPERTLVCDILANAALLPDPEGKRYGIGDETKILTAERDRLRGALSPFAALADRYDPPQNDDWERCWDADARPTLGQLRAARNAIAGKE